MNTISHLIINAAIHKKADGNFQISKPAFLAGAVLPDIPLGLLYAGTYIYYGLILQQDISNLMEEVIHPAFFNNPWWISAHNVLHTPLLLGLAIVLLWRYQQRPGSRGHWGLWFVLGSFLHTLSDILTHTTDGPLLLFPFEWQTRFKSPISYWDPQYFGQVFFIFEIVLGLTLLGYLFLPGLIRKFKA